MFFLKVLKFTTSRQHATILRQNFTAQRRSHTRVKCPRLGAHNQVGIVTKGQPGSLPAVCTAMISFTKTRPWTKNGLCKNSPLSAPACLLSESCVISLLTQTPLCSQGSCRSKLCSDTAHASTAV